MNNSFKENLIGRNLKNEHNYTYTIVSAWLEEDKNNSNFGNRVAVLAVGNAGTFYGETIKVLLPDPYWKINT